MATRRIRIDDTDPAIKYAPNQWFPHDVNQLNTLGNLGSVWNGTSHSTSTTTASLTFPFNGTSIDVIGTIQLNDLADDPTWVCLVDEIQITNGTDPTFKFPENNWILCSQPQLLPGPHTLTIKVQSKGQPFYLDSIFYTPTPDVTYDGAVLEYEAGDPAISYGAGWQFYTVENTQNITQTNGAQVALNFHGTAVTLTGYVPQELPHNATTAKYSVDGGPATTVTLAGLPPQGTTTIFNVPMLSVSNLSPTTHNIVITYEGDSGHTPLAVKNFYVTNSTTPVLADSHFSSASSPSSTPTKTSTPPVVATKHTPVGAIAGGVVGGLALLALLAGLLFFLRRRRQRERGETPQRSDHGVDPFGIETAEAGGGAGAASIATGRATHGTSDAAGAGVHAAPRRWCGVRQLQRQQQCATARAARRQPVRPVRGEWERRRLAHYARDSVGHDSVSVPVRLCAA
ncbi:hypothetical protein B0H14DRAFT_1022154 [Mycena olivaceomarginata]|nr:hypothetical protein B0H14DRAFT_1022154 [Mycena olivaceomarginata]